MTFKPDAVCSKLLRIKKRTGGTHEPLFVRFPSSDPRSLVLRKRILRRGPIDGTSPLYA
jgi:hypothetical protein